MLSNKECFNKNLLKLRNLEKLRGMILSLKDDFFVFDSWKRITKSRRKIFSATLNTFFNKVVELEKLINDPLAVNKLKTEFRKELQVYTRKSVFATHGLRKPRGYPGDASIIEAVYENKTRSEGVGLLLDLYFLNDKYVQAVRDRKDYTKAYLYKFINSASGVEQLRIMNLACGACREIRELLVEKKLPPLKIALTCIDQDAVTIDYSKAMLADLPKNLKIHFRCDNVINLYNSNFKSSPELVPKQDLIYSIGLADYLPNSVLIPLLRACFNHLRPNGMLFIAHKNVAKYPEPVSDWFCDWNFFVRSRVEFDKLLRIALKKDSFSLRYAWSDSKLLFYAIIKKI